MRPVSTDPLRRTTGGSLKLSPPVGNSADWTPSRKAHEPRADHRVRGALLAPGRVPGLASPAAESPGLWNVSGDTWKSFRSDLGELGGAPQMGVVAYPERPGAAKGASTRY